MSPRIKLLATLLALAPALQAAEPERAVERVDLRRNAGTWYEQAHLPLFFQRDCARDTTATYTLRDDGRIDVLNRCTKADGTTKQANGVARRVGDSTSKLEVRFAPTAFSFLPFVWGDYWIIDLDEDYRWALVGTPSRDNLWILSRDRVLDPTVRTGLVERARAMGYPVEKLIDTPQG